MHLKNKCADQPAHPHSLISTFVIQTLVKYELNMYHAKDHLSWVLFCVLSGIKITMAVFLWLQMAYAAASPAPLAYADHMDGDG